MLKIDDEKLQKEKIEADSKLTCQILAEKFNVSFETVRLHLQKLGKSYRLGCWVPHELSYFHKMQRVIAAEILFNRYELEPSFLNRIITSDEK